MDKESVILKHFQYETEQCEKDKDKLASINGIIEARLNVIDANLESIYKSLNMEKRTLVCMDKGQLCDNLKYPVQTVRSYDQIFDFAAKSLVQRGIDVENLDYHDLVSEEELKYITDNLNRPLEKKLKWEKNDFIAVFVVASIGSLVDLILCDRNNEFAGKNSPFSEWLNKFHQHDQGAPIDYQGPDFGGGFHRGLSKGHDILRFIEAIMMFKSGNFEAIRYIDGVAHKVKFSLNQYDNPYEQLGWIEAILKYAQHMFADLFSSCSLPFPGSSFLVESDTREVRKFAATMYQQGFNIKNILIQSLTTIVVEVLLRIYFGIDEVKRYKSGIEIKEDYSNYEAICKFVRPSGTDKLYEMLLLTHIIVAAINVGKVVITKKPWEINVTEMLCVVRYAIPVLNTTIDRHSGYAKLIRNANEIQRGWEVLAAQCSVDNLSIEFPENTLTI